MTREVSVFWHDALLEHDTGSGVVSAGPNPLLEVLDRHPEGPERFRNLRALLRRGPLADRVAWRSGRLAAPAELLRVHTADHVEAVERACAEGGELAHARLSPASWTAALASAGTALRAAEHALDGEWSYSLGRPTGHHAGPATGDGFCLFNQEALAAERARALGARRVAILDWDVHHGNGTQACFYERDDVLTISLHMRHGAWDPVTHPETGAEDELGRDAGRGHNVNVDFDLGVGDAGHLAAFDELVAPIVASYAPDLLIVAAGQDAGCVDPLGRQNMTMTGFRALGARTRALVEEHCGGRLLLIQEGGYQPAYGPLCAHSTLEGLLDSADALEDPVAFIPDDPRRGREDIERTRRTLQAFWPCLQRAEAA